MVSFRESFGDLLDDLYRTRNGQAFVPHQVYQRLAFDQFHHDIGLSLRGLSVIVNVGDVLMRERRDRARFAQKAGAKVLVTRTALAVQSLDGNATLQQNVLGQIDHAHAAFAEFLDNAIVGYGLANHGANYSLKTNPEKC